MLTSLDFSPQSILYLKISILLLLFKVKVQTKYCKLGVVDLRPTKDKTNLDKNAKNEDEEGRNSGKVDEL